MTDTNATRLAGNNSDETRLAGESYRTRLATSSATDDKTRIAQVGYQSKLARDVIGVQPDASELYKVGDKIGDRYEVSAIHHGAMGVVYGCFDHQTKLPRALKTVRSRHLRDKQVLSLFENEAAVWISLEKHPYIVRAYSVEKFNKLPYVITEYVRGPEGMEGDLRGWLGHPRLTLPIAVTMALQIAQGMQHALRKVPNLVHRDLKPANILVNGDGKAMVTDFGLVDSEQAGAGTPAYMSPEQWRENLLDARSDIYAYGCILFEMFTGHRLFAALTEREWEDAHLMNTPVALTNLVPELPGEIDQYVRRCLEKNVDARPQSWDEVVTFFAEWYHRLTGKSVVLDFSSLELDACELVDAGSSLMTLKRHKEMLSAFNRAILIDKKNELAWMGKVAALCHLSRLEEAIDAADQSLAINQDCDRLWCVKGMVLNMLSRFEDEISAYDQALKIDQNDIEAWWRKGYSLRRLKRYEEATQACNQALTINPNDVNSRHCIGLVLYDLKRYVEAIEAFTQIILINSTDANTWFWKGMALSSLNRFDEAIEALDQAIIHENSIDRKIIPLHEKASTLYKLNRFNEAVSAYDQVLLINPKYAATWHSKGMALCELKRYEEAIQAFDHAPLFDQSYSAWAAKGSAFYTLKRYEDAAHAYIQAIALKPNAAAWGCHGLSLYNLKQYEEALQSYEKSIALDQKNSVIWHKKGLALLELNRFEEAIQAEDQALAINQTDFGAWLNKGNALYSLQRYDEAIQAYDRARAINLNDTNVVQKINSAVAALNAKLVAEALKSERNSSFSWARFFGK